LLAFSWGTLGSTLSRTTLGSVGIAIATSSLAAFVFLFPITIFFAPPGSSLPRPNGWYLFVVLMLFVPLIASAWRYTAPDRARAGIGARRDWGMRALVWLSVRQLRLTGFVLSAFAVAFGCALLAPDIRTPVVWPALALAAGVLAGVTIFGEEQSRDIAGFWAERRLPLFRVWLVKVVVHLCFLVWLLFLLALPCILRSQFDSQMRSMYGRMTFSSVFNNRLFDEIGSQSWKYLLTPAAYGFATAHVVGLLFRKVVVACGVSLMIGGSLSVAWGPSLLAGGVKHWQLWLPACALLLCGLLMIRAWASYRILNRGPLLRLVGGSCGVLLTLLFSLSHRVLEIPDNPNGGRDVDYVNSLPSYDENIGGREFRAASERYARTVAIAQAELDRASDSRRRIRMEERLDAVFRPNWNGNDPEITAWLDRVFLEETGIPDEKPWFVLANVAAEKPVGIYEPPQLVGSVAMSAQSLENARRMAIALLARGLQQQAGGGRSQFPQAVRTSMVLAQNLRSGGVQSLVQSYDILRIVLVAIDRWLERDTGNAEQLREVIRLLEDLRPTQDPNTDEFYLADRFVLREMMRVPNAWLAPQLTPPGGNPDQYSEEADLVAFAWTVPWERERTRRLVNYGYAPNGNGYQPIPFSLLVGRPGSNLLLLRARSSLDLVESDQYLRVALGAAIVKCAVRAYQIEQKTAPNQLNQLVASGYLKHAPLDPFLPTQALGFRVSPGEDLRPVSRLNAAGRVVEDGAPLKIEAGQIVVWSVGTDRVDQGGQSAPSGIRGPDIVVLVTMQPLKK
jgi:hypothetical protein